MKIASLFKRSNEVEEKSSETPEKSVGDRVVSETNEGDSAIDRIEKVFNRVFKGKILFQQTVKKEGKWDSLKLGKELGIKVVGSYRPGMFGCKVDEFYDHMHPKAVCLSRLKVQNTDLSRE